MFLLTREVRFTRHFAADSQLQSKPENSYGGWPAMVGFGTYFRLCISVSGELEPASNYLINIKQIDAAVRERIIAAGLTTLDPNGIFARLKEAFDPLTLEKVELWVTPFCSVCQEAGEIGMATRLSQKFEFSASHRLHNASLSAEENVKLYGKCNNPTGHGHNYEVQVTLRGTPREGGLLVHVPAFERIVKQEVIDKLDHKHLNSDVPEFRQTIPSVENISRVIYGMLKAKFSAIDAELASVTVWETPKTWCEYSEEE